MLAACRGLMRGGLSSRRSRSVVCPTAVARRGRRGRGSRLFRCRHRVFGDEPLFARWVGDRSRRRRSSRMFASGSWCPALVPRCRHRRWLLHQIELHAHDAGTGEWLQRFRKDQQLRGAPVRRIEPNDADIRLAWRRGHDAHHAIGLECAREFAIAFRSYPQGVHLRAAAAFDDLRETNGFHGPP